MIQPPHSIFGLQGKVALVTGGTQGLGLAICKLLVEHGAHVVVSDIDDNACQSTTIALREQGGAAQGIACDLSAHGAAQDLVRRAILEVGPVDVLVCNAGIQGPAGPLAEASEDDWQAVFALNLRAAAHLCNSAIPGMAARGGGSVVLMSSIAGVRGNRNIGLYGMSKAALSQLARNLAVEWGSQGVRVNSIAPGVIRTPLSQGLLNDEAFMKRRLQATPLRRVGTPEEIAGVVLMLASAAGGFITGQNLIVDGGTTISDGS
jgi:NAD(P)-dependent dehydrogenase (short-subunit alcohol dehydrogenase family)